MTNALATARTRRLLALGCALASAFALTACGGTAAQGRSAGAASSASPVSPTTASASAASTAASAEAAATALGTQGPAVLGFSVGEIPPVPLITIPDLSLLDAATDSFPTELTADVESLPGVTVSPGRCDEAGVLSSGSGATVLDGTGGYTAVDDDSSTVNYGDGSGTYTDGDSSIVNYGDGSGAYTGSGLSIVNYGDGTGVINGSPVEMVPLPPTGKAGSSPAIDAIRPVAACGTVITLDASVLFDFGSYDLRPEAASTLKNLATVLNRSGAPRATVAGHTDSISDPAFNQTLAENRAQSVVDALLADGVTADLTSVGYGEGMPVAPNTNEDGTDNPSGRQLNRRVEILVPTF